MNASEDTTIYQGSRNRNVLSTVGPTVYRVTALKSIRSCSKGGGGGGEPPAESGRLEVLTRFRVDDPALYSGACSVQYGWGWSGVVWCGVGQ